MRAICAVPDALLRGGSCSSCRCGHFTSMMIGGDCDFDGWCYLQKRFPGEPRCRDELPVLDFPATRELAAFCTGPAPGA